MSDAEEPTIEGNSTGNRLADAEVVESRQEDRDPRSPREDLQ
jgi:hypothetical protein